MGTPQPQALTASPQEVDLMQENVERWQVDNDARFAADVQPGIIGSLFHALMICLNDVLKVFRQQNNRGQIYRDLEKHAAALLFWGIDHNVACGNLDSALQHSGYLRDTVLFILISIGETISKGLLRLGLPETTCTQISEASSIVTVLEQARLIIEEAEDAKDLLENSQELELNEKALCIVLQRHIQSLGLLNSSLQLPTSVDDQEEHGTDPARPQTHEPYQYFVDMVAARFPSADPQLVQMLGQSNWKRFNHVQHQRDAPQTEVPTTEQAKSEFHDSGLGTTLATAPTLYAATVLSSRAEVSHKRLPSLPKQGKSGEPFSCCVCDRKVIIRTTKAWKSHIFQDICAYSCIYKTCTSPGILFEEPKALSLHLRAHHRFYQNDENQECPLCQERLAYTEKARLLHVQRHLEEIALRVLPPTVDADDDSESSESNSEGSNSSLSRVVTWHYPRSRTPDSLVNHTGYSPRPLGSGSYSSQGSTRDSLASDEQRAGHNTYKAPDFSISTDQQQPIFTIQDDHEENIQRKTDDKIRIAHARRQAQVEMEAQKKRDLEFSQQQANYLQTRELLMRQQQAGPRRNADKPSEHPQEQTISIPMPSSSIDNPGVASSISRPRRASSQYGVPGEFGSGPGPHIFDPTQYHSSWSLPHPPNSQPLAPDHDCEEHVDL